MEYILELDKTIFLYLNNNLNNPTLNIVFNLFNQLGNWWFLTPISLCLIYYFDRKNFKNHFFLLLICAVASGIILHFFKWLFKRPRPLKEFELLIDQGKVTIYWIGKKLTGENSFPSGHTQTAFTAATFFYYFFRKNYFILLYSSAVLVGIARIYSGVHFPLDTIAGAIIGITIPVIIIKNYNRKTKEL